MYQHFQGMGSKDVWARYREHRDPRAMLCVQLSGLGTPDSYRNHLDKLNLSGVVIAPYGDNCEARQFERVSLYSGWLRYLPERVLRQFGSVQTRPRHPADT